MMGMIGRMGLSLPAPEEVDAEEADGGGEGVDEEVGVVAQLLDQPAAERHRHYHGG